MNNFINLVVGAEMEQSRGYLHSEYRSLCSACNQPIKYTDLLPAAYQATNLCLQQGLTDILPRLTSWLTELAACYRCYMLVHSY